MNTSLQLFASVSNHATAVNGDNVLGNICIDVIISIVFTALFIYLFMKRQLYIILDLLECTRQDIASMCSVEDDYAPAVSLG